MNPKGPFERDLERWLAAEAPVRGPAGLHQTAIDRARTLNQRPRWAASLRGRTIPGPVWALGRPAVRATYLLVVLGLILALVLGAIAAGALRSPMVRPPGWSVVATNTFTKWATGPGDAPVVANMAGAVGGAVGDGTFAGEVLARTPNASGAVLDAFYHLTGSAHVFTALVHVVQTGLEAVITGRITDGWLYGSDVAGAYTQTTCPDSPAADQKCFQGTLDILQGSPQDFLMTQTCDTPTSCTVTTSSFGPITAGTELFYTPDSTAGCVIIWVPDGRVTGTCDLDQPAPVVGKFTFAGGTGVFDQFHLVADATVADKTYPGAVWTWTGTYWFGDGA
jgi:hypothetical protein